MQHDLHLQGIRAKTLHSTMLKNFRLLISRTTRWFSILDSIPVKERKKSKPQFSSTCMAWFSLIASISKKCGAIKFMFLVVNDFITKYGAEYTLAVTKIQWIIFDNFVTIYFLAFSNCQINTRRGAMQQFTLSRGKLGRIGIQALTAALLVAYVPFDNSPTASACGRSSP